MDELSPRERLAKKAAAEARPGAWMSDEEERELRREEQSGVAKQRSRRNSKQSNNGNRGIMHGIWNEQLLRQEPGAWMSDEEKAELEAAKERRKERRDFLDG